MDWRFPMRVGLTLAIAGVLGGYPLLAWAPGDILVAVLLGALLSTINVLLGYLAIELSFDKSYTVFLRSVLGGMGVRLLFLLGVLVLLIQVFRVHTVALTVSVLGFYSIFLILEILFIQGKVLMKTQE